MAAMRSAGAAKVEQHDANRAFSKEAMVALRPVAQEYATKLRERGISSNVDASEHGISFKMQWAIGASHGLTVQTDYKTGRLEIWRNSTEHTTGKQFRSTDGVTYDGSTWEPSKFESALKSVINDYVSYADKHHGVA
jgi:hypothetical protein